MRHKLKKNHDSILSKENRNLVIIVYIISGVISFMIFGFAAGNVFLHSLMLSEIFIFFTLFFHIIGINIHYNEAKNSEKGLFSEEIIRFTANKMMRLFLVFVGLFIVFSFIPEVEDAYILTIPETVPELIILLMLLLSNLLLTLPLTRYFFTKFFEIEDYYPRIQRVDTDQTQLLKGVALIASIFFLKLVLDIIYANIVQGKQLEGIEFLEGQGIMVLLLNICIGFLLWMVSLQSISDAKELTIPSK